MDETVIATEVLDPARMAALAVLLGIEWNPSDPLPPFAHQIYFWDAVPAARLGRDGHPRVGQGLIPDLGLPRRMWAGGRVEFLSPLHVGREAEKRSTRLRVERKEGRSGSLGFVTLRHEIAQGGRLCVVEEQDLVYREEADPAAAAPQASRQAPADAAEVRRRRFSTTDLFRYSALTFNGHRIHYDAPYARDVEGYDGLVVHGPLLAQMLVLQSGADIRRFSFRGVSALMDHEEGAFCRAGDELWVAGPDGRLCMTATRG